VIDELASRKKQEEKDTETARNKETLKSGGSTRKPKKAKTSKKKKVDEQEVEVDDLLETCKLMSHKTDKQGEVRVQVKWDDSGQKDWQYLYDMWADYPDEVMDYRKKHQKTCKSKVWKDPNIDDVEYFVRILGMLGGEGNVTKAKFIVLANNGYRFDGEDCVTFDEINTDDAELLEAFLDSVENSPEADDATIA
jgi:hypothetical protein